MNSPSYDKAHCNQAIDLLKELIQTPSFSKQEHDTTAIIENFLLSRGIQTNRIHNNVIACNLEFIETKPTILLNSHHDTVKPNSGYTNDPFDSIVADDKLYGLGSNDAGGCLVSLIETFIHFYEKKNLPYNVILAASAEEEISGDGGVASILKGLPSIDFGIVGEPTGMEMAIAEKGLMVLDCEATGQSGHAARDEGTNAIYEAIEDINWFRAYQFPKVSDTLGPIKMSVTLVEAGTQHNVVPAQCKFVVDVRTTDAYSNKETLDIIKESVKCSVKARSTRLSPSGIGNDSPLIKAATTLGIKTFGSSTLSDQALMDFPTIKMGPGKSERSHTADEFIYIQEINEGIAGYINLLETLFHLKQTTS